MFLNLFVVFCNVFAFILTDAAVTQSHSCITACKVCHSGTTLEVQILATKPMKKYDVALHQGLAIDSEQHKHIV